MSRAKFSPIDPTHLGFTYSEKEVKKERSQKRGLYEGSKIETPDKGMYDVHFPYDVMSLYPSTPIGRIVSAQPATSVIKVQPTVKKEYVACDQCDRVYEILPGCPLLDPVVRDQRAELSHSYDLYLNPKTECHDCSIGWECSGWCMIVDSFDDDRDPEWKSIQKAELAKYDEGVKAGRKIRDYLKDTNLTMGPIKNVLETSRKRLYNIKSIWDATTRVEDGKPCIIIRLQKPDDLIVQRVRDILPKNTNFKVIPY